MEETNLKHSPEISLDVSELRARHGVKMKNGDESLFHGVILLKDWMCTGIIGIKI